MVLSILALTACSSEESTSTATPDAPDATSEGGDTAAEGEAVTLDAWTFSWIPSYDDYFAGTVDKFAAENPGVDITYTTMPMPELNDKLAISLSADDGPDLFKAVDVMPYINAELIVEMPADLQEQEKALLYEQWIPDLGTDGKLYSLPDIGGPKLLLYNTEMFAEAGLEGPPETWDELVEYAEKLTVFEGDTMVRAGIQYNMGSNANYLPTLSAFMLTNGGDFITEDGELIFNSPESVEALQFWLDLDQVHNVTSFDFASDSYSLGHAAMVIDESNVLSSLETNNPEIAEKTAFALIPPKDENGTAVPQGYTFKWMVSAASEHQDIAWDFLVHYAHDWAAEGAMQFYMPIFYQAESEAAIQQLTDEGNDALLPLYESSELSVIRPASWRSYTVPVGEWMERAMLGEVSAQEALDGALPEVQAALDEGGAF